MKHMPAPSWPAVDSKPYIPRMKSRLGTVAMTAVATVVLGYAAAVGFLAVRETSLVYQSAGSGRSTRIVPPRDELMGWDTLRVRDSSGASVFLLESRVDGSNERPWVIYFHGNAGLVGSRGNVRRYGLLKEAGFNVLAVEYRGYGASSSGPGPTERGVYEDATAAWNHLTRTLGVAASRVVVYGWSLGSGPATYLAAEHRPAALITEGAFTSLPAIGAEMYPWVPVRYIMRNRFDNLERAAGLSIPWLLFHGKRDLKVPFSHGQALAAAARHAQFVQLESGHDGGVVEDSGVALEALRELAKRLH
jgi:pimeloyl-ACP methyl ester carboxylesterase